MNPLVIAAAAQAAPQLVEKMMPLYKGMFYTILAVGGGYVIYRIVKENTKDAPGNNLSQLQINTRNLSYSTSEYGLMAQKMFLAMDGYGTNETDLFSVLNSMKNRDDVLMLIKQFGVKRYGIVTSLWFGQDLNLIGWLNSKLSGNDLQRAGSIIRAFGIPF
jgi:hypothetical protein